MRSELRSIGCGRGDDLAAAATATPKPRIYIDAMVIVYHLGSDTASRLFELNARFLSRVKRGEVEPVVSTFCLTEAAAVIVELLTKQRDRLPTQTERERIQTRIEQFVDAFGLEVLSADELVALPDGEVDLFARTKQIIDAAKPVQGSYDRKWRMVGGADAIHVALAERAKANILATFDEGFRTVQSPVSVEILGRRP